jgi:glutamate synthase (NADPH/NADH) small chain
MSAFPLEYEHAKQEGVKFLWHSQPVALHGEDTVSAVELQGLAGTSDGPLVPSGKPNVLLPVETVVVAIGQSSQTALLARRGALLLENGRIVIDRATGQTSNPKYFAGGDCTNGGREVVDAVAEGKRAALGISAWLQSQEGKYANA